ncbi:helix-turn-helix domain-containing protein [Saccharopolyspora phatthalungensis]|uniref:Excisionase family DNA binding protein n=1 Tax=Saccharopolyspora phatthalungensis TaxID=664693 RepID=A0A840Q3A5_9PSEU|nr:helix-turn-helix domain-containing protein [Saccharopolyspora phatthalungensis]MBB5154984.1 excisionase family DNA binding protein [Saccharopolyspora phatthalungensis]
MTEAAEILGYNRSHVHQLINEGKLPAGYAGNTVVLAEDTVRRYAVGERFSFPTLLVVHVYDNDADGWTEASRTAVAPDYEMPETFRLEDIAGVEDRSYRVELLDNQGKTLGIKTVEPVN